MTSAFASKSSFEASHPHALAMYCSDGRFTEGVEELLRHLGHARLDTLTMPGGPALLELTSAGLSAIDTARSAVSFLVVGHAIRDVVLIAHESCGYYRNRLPYESTDAMLARQTADLRSARRWLCGAHEKVNVRTFYARTRESQLSFEETTEGTRE